MPSSEPTSRVSATFAALPLFWRVFLMHALILALAVAALAIAPVTVSVPVEVAELVVLVFGMLTMLVLDLILLRPVFQPLHEMTSTMRGIDPLEPGRRVGVGGSPELATVAETFNDMLDRLESERRESARQALRVQEGERERVARELHDEVGQTLTAMMLQIESLAAKVPEELRDELEELRETTRAGAEDVRRIAVRLRPEALEDLGLETALMALVRSFREHSGVRVEPRIEQLPQLSPEQELVIYRVAQEALTNIARHAHATAAAVDLVRDDGVVTLRVRDDGRGVGDRARSSSTGIRGMRERAMLVGGRMTIVSADGRGTEVALQLPVAA
jgi:two-component system sensor histidine kinase UhpB